jgi:hypothetical protein
LERCNETRKKQKHKKMTDLCLDQVKLAVAAGGAVLVILGVSFKNAPGQRISGSGRGLGPLGPILFTAGWVAVAYAAGTDCGSSPKSLISVKGGLTVGTIALIVTSVMSIMQSRSKNTKAPMVASIGFMMGWVALAVLVGFNHKFKSVPASQIAGGIGAASVLTAMALVLPRERTSKVTDGIGMPMFTAGWAAIAFAIAHACSASGAATATTSAGGLARALRNINIKK